MFCHTFVFVFHTYTFACANITTTAGDVVFLLSNICNSVDRLT